MKTVLLAALSLFITAAAQASGNPPRVYLVTTVGSASHDCPALVVGSVQTKSAGTFEIANVMMNLESGVGGEAAEFRHVSQCLTAAPCDAYDVGAITMDDGQKLTLMFRHNSKTTGVVTAGFAELTVLTAKKTCSYALTDMGPGYDMAPLD